MKWCCWVARLAIAGKRRNSPTVFNVRKCCVLNSPVDWGLFRDELLKFVDVPIALVAANLSGISFSASSDARELARISRESVTKR